MTDTFPTAVAEWRDAGHYLSTEQGEVFVLDTGSPPGAIAGPLLVLHGFPTSSFDFRNCLIRWATDRRVILFDFLGFGLSDKPDRRYGIHLHADTTETVVASLGLDEVDLLTHDMGDSVGGEVLARSLEGRLGFGIGRRVLSNGSIYLDMAQLTVGQQLLMGLPDAPTELTNPDAVAAGAAATHASGYPASAEELACQAALSGHQDGHRLMPRLIRYLEDRQAEERRYTGAIETHPSPLGVVWGALDPVAVFAMTDTLLAARRDTPRITLDDVGHYPMVEAPERFAKAVDSLL